MPRGPGYPTDEAIALLADALAYYDETDVQRWFKRSARLTGHYPTVWPSTIDAVRTFKRVPNEPFRKAWVTHNQPLIMGIPGTISAGGSGMAQFDGTNSSHPESETCALFRAILAERLVLPEGVDFLPEKTGPTDLSTAGITNYLARALGIRHSTSNGRINVSYLIQYEIAEVLAKTLGLVPIQVGI